MVALSQNYVLQDSAVESHCHCAAGPLYTVSMGGQNRQHSTVANQPIMS